MHRLITQHLVRGYRIIAGMAILLCYSPTIVGQDTFDLNEQTFNQWLFQASQGAFDSESELTLTLEAIDRVCRLNAQQREKLRLAGRGDYARFEQSVDELLAAEYVGKTYSQNEIGEIYQKIQPLGATYQAGLLGESSLFAKVLAQSLTSEQSEEIEQVEAERRQARHAAKVRLFVAAMERSCPLTDAQRTAMVELLLAETRAPMKFSRYDWYLMLYQAGKIPDEKYQPIVDEAQMRFLKQMLQQGQGMAHFLRQQKILDDE